MFIRRARRITLASGRVRATAGVAQTRKRSQNLSMFDEAQRNYSKLVMEYFSLVMNSVSTLTEDDRKRGN